MTEYQRKSPSEPVYSRMLRDYCAAADKLLVRQTALKHALPDCMPERRRELEQRIRLLRTEYEDVSDLIRCIRFYAAREDMQNA